MTRFTYIALIIMVSLSSIIARASEATKVDIIALKTSAIKLTLTPDIGGRVLSFSLLEGQSVLKLSDDVNQYPHPSVSASADNIGYLGHEMWVGPQSEWWTHQTINQKRFDEKSVWPPDAYLTQAKNQVLLRTAEKVVLQGPPSPVTGVQMLKSYALVKNNPNQVVLNVETRNARDSNVSWDTWFNSRVFPDSQIYVPVEELNDVRVNQMPDATTGPLTYHVANGVFSLDLAAPPKGKSKRLGKILIQPSAGWMAAFNKQQVFIIQFPLQPKSAIHPEQGQVELYHDYRPQTPAEGLLEMEVHAPYVTLKPGDTMAAQERWTLLPYRGENTRAAQLAFLRAEAKGLGLDKL